LALLENSEPVKGRVDAFVFSVRRHGEEARYFVALGPLPPLHTTGAPIQGPKITPSRHPCRTGGQGRIRTRVEPKTSGGRPRARIFVQRREEGGLPRSAHHLQTARWLQQCTMSGRGGTGRIHREIGFGHPGAPGGPVCAGGVEVLCRPGEGTPHGASFVSVASCGQGAGEA
jgi:hypothetical protein